MGNIEHMDPKPPQVVVMYLKNHDIRDINLFKNFKYNIRIHIASAHIMIILTDVIFFCFWSNLLYHIIP